MGECTLQRREEASGDASAAAATPLAVSGTRLKPRTRVYAKQTGDARNDPHLKGFYERHNYCRMDGQPYYSYQFGGDYEDIFQTPKRLNDVHDALDQGVAVSAEPQPQPDSSQLTSPQGILEGFAVSSIQKIHPQKRRMKMKGRGDVHVDRVYTTAVPGFVSTDGDLNRMKFVGQATPPSGLSLESTVYIGWNASVDMATVQQIDWPTFFANVYQVEKAYVSIEKIVEQQYAFHINVRVDKATVNSTYAALSKRHSEVNQTLQSRVESIISSQNIDMPNVQFVSSQKFKFEKDTGVENVRIDSPSLEAMQHVQVTATGVRVLPKTSGVQAELIVLFDLPPVTSRKPTNVVTTFSLLTSDTTDIDIFCGWKLYSYRMAASVTSGSYTFTVSSQKGQPVLRLEKQGESEPLNVLQLNSPPRGAPKNEPLEINHLQAFEPGTLVFDHLNNMFQHTALGFKISHMTGTDSIRDLTIRVQ